MQAAGGEGLLPARGACSATRRELGIVKEGLGDGGCRPRLDLGGTIRVTSIEHG